MVRFLFFLVGLSTADLVYAQTNDPFVGSWLWTEHVEEILENDFSAQASAGLPYTVGTFIANGTYLANDASEFTPNAIHGTSHGNWVKTGEHTAEVTTISLNLSADKSNGFTGTSVYRISLVHDPVSDALSGQMNGTTFPEGVDPFTANPADGVALPTYVFVGIQRIEVDPVSNAAGQDLADEIPVGAWFGTAVATNQATAAFADLAFEPSFLSDGNFLYNDVQEEAQQYTMAHGQWAKTSDTTFEAVAVRVNQNEPNSTIEGWVKIRFSGQINPANSEELSGTLSLLAFPIDTDPLDPADTGATPLGTFVVDSLGRLRTFSPPRPNANLAGDLAIGSWFGRAIPDDPSQSPFPEVYMIPTFLADGNFIANDAIATSLHHTAHGDWVRIDANTLESTFLFIIGTPDPTNPLGSLFRLKFTGITDPDHPDVMRGKVAPMLFPPGTNPLDLESTDGIPLVGLTFPELKRVQVLPFQTAVLEGLKPANVPQNYRLQHAYPNPFNPTTTIRFSLPVATTINLKIYNVQGQMVRHLVEQTVATGQYAVHWDGRDDSGRSLASGTYVYQLEAAEIRLQRKVTFLK